MEEYIDDLIAQTKEDIKKAQKRLETLNMMKSQISISNKTTTVREASRMLGISEQSIRLWLRLGKLRGRRVGCSYMIDIDSIKEALAGK